MQLHRAQAASRCKPHVRCAPAQLPISCKSSTQHPLALCMCIEFETSSQQRDSSLCIRSSPFVSYARTGCKFSASLSMVCCC